MLLLAGIGLMSSWAKHLPLRGQRRTVMHREGFYLCNLLHRLPIQVSCTLKSADHTNNNGAQGTDLWRLSQDLTPSSMHLPSKIGLLRRYVPH